jgi:tRNA/rRNA methyltransferase
MIPEPTTAPVLVLVAVQDLVNLASCIRVAKNFGITELRLVRPECPLDPVRLEGIAHHAGDVIAAMQVYDDLDSAFADLVYVQALTGRERTAKRTILRPRPAAAELIERSETGRVGILAGREDHGLHNEELDRCDALVTISANPDYTSLNLAQATGIYCYETWLARGGDRIRFKPPRHKAPMAPHSEIEALFRDWQARDRVGDAGLSRGDLPGPAGCARGGVVPGDRAGDRTLPAPEGGAAAAAEPASRNLG